MEWWEADGKQGEERGIVSDMLLLVVLQSVSWKVLAF